MAKQETLIPQKRRGPVPTGKGEPIMCRLQPELLDKLDQFIAKGRDDISRPEAIRRLVELGLRGQAGRGHSKQTGPPKTTKGLTGTMEKR